MTFLTMEERLQLMREIALCEEVMCELFKPAQTNVAMIGNKTPQLHVHIIARSKAIPMAGERCGTVIKKLMIPKPQKR